MDKNNRKIQVILVPVVIIICMLLSVWVTTLNLSPFVENVLPLVVLFVIALVWLIIYWILYQKFFLKLKALQPFLGEEDDANRYICEINTLLAEQKSPQYMRRILKNNLSCAYIAKKGFNTAKELLMQINPRNLLIFRMIAEGNQAGARQLLEQTRSKWENERAIPDFEYLDKLC